VLISIMVICPFAVLSLLGMPSTQDTIWYASAKS